MGKQGVSGSRPKLAGVTLVINPQRYLPIYTATLRAKPRHTMGTPTNKSVVDVRWRSPANGKISLGGCVTTTSGNSGTLVYAVQWVDAIKTLGGGLPRISLPFFLANHFLSVLEQRSGTPSVN